MRESRILAALLDEHVNTLRTQLGGVYDGGVAAVHDARVATRRIRELLALVPAVPGRERRSDPAERYKKVGRALGRVRDIDVQISLIRSLEDREPQVAPLLLLMRQEDEGERLEKARRLIKTLERTDVDALLHGASQHNLAGPRRQITSSGWRRQLERLMLERSRTAACAITHATGVYFPKRAHGARIAIKRVRYAADIAEAVGLAVLPSAVKSLRKGQEILGELHDRQALSDALERYARDENVPRDQVELTHGIIEREIMQLHQQYLARRDSLRDACTSIADATVHAWRPGPTVAIGAALAVSGILYSRYALAGHGVES